MWRVIRYLRGYARISILGAGPEGALNRMARQRIGFWAPQTESLCIHITILQKDLPRVQPLIESAQCEMKLLHQTGIRQSLGSVWKRPGMWVALAMIAVVPGLLCQFVWTIDVSGNDQVPAERILQQLTEEGVCVGAYGPNIRSQDIKNRMLGRIPELQWLAVNRSGGRLQILVEERTPIPVLTDRKKPRNLVAAKTGLLTKVEVYEGTNLCKVGQTVLQGQLLVSGYEQMEVNLHETHAQAEIYARTWRGYTYKVPAEMTEKNYTGNEVCRYAIQLGRKRRNLLRNSGILTGSYDKIIEIKQLTLPGDITFPFYWLTERYREYEIELVKQENAEQMAVEAAIRHAESDMIAGKVLEVSAKSDGEEITVVLECEEMIARPVETVKSAGLLP